MESTKIISTTGPTGPIGCIGPMGNPYRCFNCKSKNLKYDRNSNITSCEDCGWDNFLDILRNIEQRLASGEIREEYVINKLGKLPQDIVEHKGKKIYKCPCCNSYLYIDMLKES